ncbi:MAG: hypothetical protein EOP10_16640 [Proteobacteria bacterium]|nr:MAG: hypothetical protein EOP10_16640 [Pseudomonadota bacterium]
MKKLLATLALLSSPAFSQYDRPSVDQPSADDIAYVENGVITQITATPTNGGFNPTIHGVLLEGTIKAGGNSCEGSRYKVGIAESIVKGRLVLTPYVREKDNAGDFACIALYDLNYKGVEFSYPVRGTAKALNKAVVEDVGVMGRTVKLSTIPAKVPVEKPVADACDSISDNCIKILDKHSCSAVAGARLIAVEGNNKCEALINLSKAFCKAKVELKSDEAKCERSSTPTSEENPATTTTNSLQTSES